MTDIRACYSFCYADFVICMVDNRGLQISHTHGLGEAQNAPNNFFRFGNKDLTDKSRV